MRVPIPGWRHFHCEECGARWKETSRDCVSPSVEGCECGNWVDPDKWEPDKTLPVDRSGNLLKHERIVQC